MEWLAKIKQCISPAYRQYADAISEDQSIGDVVFLYCWSSLLESNETNAMDQYAPDFVSIGNDSGDCEILLKRDGTEAVYLCDAGGLGSDEPEKIHSNVGEWLEAGCPLPEEDNELPYPLRASIWLIAPPPGGIKGMFGLRRLLAQDWPVSELRRMIDDIPTKLLDDGTPNALSGTLKREAIYAGCLAYGDEDQPIAPI